VARTASEMAAADAEAMAAPPPKKRAKKAKPPPKKDQFGPRITSDDEEAAEEEELDADLVIDKVYSPLLHIRRRLIGCGGCGPMLQAQLARLSPAWHPATCIHVLAHARQAPVSSNSGYDTHSVD
jgi:hypothetical protein